MRDRPAWRARLVMAAAVVMVACATAALAGPGVARAQDAAAVVATPRYEEYQRLLDQYLTVTSAPGAPLETRFHYRDLNQERVFSERLRRIHEQLFLDVRPSTMKSAERRAWAINGYNFLVLEIVANNFYQPHLTRPVGFPFRVKWPRERVQQVTVDGVDMFSVPVVAVEGVTYNLNTFERRFVFDGFDHKSGGKPPATLDPRAHFALVCAAQGCPPLRPRAYGADSLDAQLDEATRLTLESPRHLRIDSGGLTASSIFNWYQADFGGPEGAYAFLKRHTPASMRDEIDQRGRITSFIQWDWTLNQTPLPEYVQPTPEYPKQRP